MSIRLDDGEMRVISDPAGLELAWSRQYSRLAGQYKRFLSRRHGVLVEIGCGRGQLTIPLAERIQGCQIIGVDRFKGSYAESHGELLQSLSSGGRRVGIRIIVSDYETWLTSQPDSKYDAIVSSEFLPEIDSKSMRRFFSECYRVLRPGGVTIHSFLSASPRNARQRRLIHADADPRWTKTPPAQWFSPLARLVLAGLREVGFGRLRKVELRSGLVIRSKAARQVLSDWEVRQSYWRIHRQELEEQGLEVPDWIVVTGTKTRSSFSQDQSRP